ncbi:uncharacterized protein LOC143695591 [Agelaius phoeniceus]|uniref:uncharacterized protein LOC143695591 n=1 Tax=Agelaius phoeniceus TaxID=39638 RepID=UPI004054EE7C
MEKFTCDTSKYCISSVQKIRHESHLYYCLFPLRLNCEIEYHPLNALILSCDISSSFSDLGPLIKKINIRAAVRPLKPVLEPLFQVLRSQPYPLPPPAPNIPPHAKSTARTAGSASLTSGSSPVRGVRRRAVATACADSRSPARPGASLRPSLPRQDRLSALPQPAPQSAGTHGRRVTLKRRPGPHDRPTLKGGEGWAKPALGEPPAPERRRSLTRRSHEQAASGASQRHRSPPPRPAASTRPAPALRRARSGGPARGDRRPGERRPGTDASTLPHRRDVAVEESGCLLGSSASDSYPRFCAFAWVQLHGC